ncbi:MAG: hypothetical protein K6F96_00685 [Bacteroidales bacterium]|nr:hypothetical protein [Bacteroidales bacterium]
MNNLINNAFRREFDLNAADAVNRGKEALQKNDVAAAFDLLYQAAHVNRVAHRLFLMIPEINTRLFLLTMDQEELLEEEAKKEDPLAQYTLARLYQAHGYSFDEARDLFLAAAKSGMGDAFAALALMMVNGQLDGVEIDKGQYYQGLTDAAEKNSMLGQYYMYKAVIQGYEDHPADPQAVISNIKDWLNGDESEDLLRVNPTYYEILALAYERLGDSKSAANYYMKAVRMGRVDRYHQWVLNTFFNDNMELIDEDGYVKAVEDGITMGCGYSHLLRADMNQQLYDASEDESEKAQLSEMIQQDLSTAANLGEGYGFYFHGQHSYYGNYGFTQDNNVAWMDFLNASGMNVAEAWDEMGKMYLDGEAPEGLGPDFIPYCRLMGLRQGDDNMLIPVIVSFVGGSLEKYRNEVKKYYLPRYEALSDEEKTQYFGIKFVAVVDASGSAHLTEFDFTTQAWAELEEMVEGADLEAVHNSRLDEIGEELGLEGRLTLWVDGDRKIKSYVITLEDEFSQPTAIELGQLKEIVEALGAHVDEVYYEEFPDSDNRYDPYA